MINTRLIFRTARQLRRDGFTLVELLVVIGIIAILAGIALGPITSGIEKAKENAGMQTARSINLLMFSYSNDNNQVFLPGSAAANPNPAIGTSEAIANALLNNKYASDATVFAIGNAAKYTGATSPYNLLAANINWSFMGGASTSTGLTSSAPDQTPIVYSYPGAVNPITGPTATVAGSIAIVPAAAYGLNGIAVAYKSNSAQFIKGTVTGANAATVNNFISASFSDTWGAAGYNPINP